MDVEVGKADDRLAAAMTPTAGPHLEATFFLDHDSAPVRDFTQHVIAGASSPRERASLLFAAVRDRVWYDPYSVARDREHYRASYVLETGRAYCVPKAVLLTAALRAAGIPARLGFADVRNHLQTDTLRAVMGGTDLFVYHGYCSVHLDGRWLKATPAFDVELCERFDVPPVDFDGQSDALMHAFTSDGTRHMEYVRDHGSFDDLPLDRILTALDLTYGRMAPGVGVADDAFIAPADAREATEHAPVDPSGSSD
ncbi:Transglutaminase-like superfamily protein [Nocardioides alpinus]|uniref:Transglutaminase-like superfamily protein n=2 Tax=Nocardioides alpinus TaxID=748909 RepID=A0A1I0VFY6_9ACTN|nr:transglutaminase domain-containing protein [Nocardioides alpinus]SFA75274.1 Transglutaminase-like superfamily protein [Nocardioides alpinus]